MEDKEEIRFEEMADETNPHIKAGDLIVVLEQKPHSHFNRVKRDLYIELSISLAEAIGGFELPVETLDKRILLIRNEQGRVSDNKDCETKPTYSVNRSSTLI